MTVLEEIDDAQLPVIQKMAYRIWPVVFKDILTEAQVSYMLDWMYSIPALQEQRGKGHRFILAKTDDRCTGYASYEAPPAGGEARLHKIYVLPCSQGSGIGKMLLGEVADRARESGCRVLSLNVNRYNKAIHFYEKLGFRIVKEEDNAIGNGFFMNDYVMAKEL